MITTTSVGDVVQRAGVSVLCKKAPLGYERLQGQEGTLFASELPDTTFFFSAALNNGMFTIENATEWAFERAPIKPARANGYAQASDFFLWGQRVRCVQSPAHYCCAVDVEGTLQPFYGDGNAVATFHSNKGTGTWAVGREGWRFEKVVAGTTSDRSEWVTVRHWFLALIGSRQRIVRSPWTDCIGQETVIEEVQNCMNLDGSLGAIVSFEVRHDGDVRRCGIGETNWRNWGFETVDLRPSTDGKTFDVVDHPKHYNVHPSGVECIEIMERLGSNLGSAFKYIWRAESKHDTPITDLKKALWYLHRELNIKWEPSTATQERVKRVVSHESFNNGSAMMAIFSAANSENGSVDKRAVIETAIESIESELRRLGT